MITHNYINNLSSLFYFIFPIKFGCCNFSQHPMNLVLFKDVI